VSLEKMDLSEIETIERERELAAPEKKLPWYRVVI
jgi:hypothetical protein